MIQRMLKGKFGEGVQICEGGSISASGFGPGGGSRSAVTPARIPYRSSLGGKMEWLTASKALLKSRNIDTA